MRDFPYFLCIVGFFKVMTPVSPSMTRHLAILVVVGGEGGFLFRIHLANVHNAWAVLDALGRPLAKLGDPKFIVSRKSSFSSKGDLVWFLVSRHTPKGIALAKKPNHWRTWLNGISNWKVIQISWYPIESFEYGYICIVEPSPIGEKDLNLPTFCSHTLLSLLLIYSRMGKDVYGQPYV